MSPARNKKAEIDRLRAGRQSSGREARLSPTPVRAGTFPRRKDPRAGVSLVVGYRDARLVMVTAGSVRFGSPVHAQFPDAVPSSEKRSEV